MIESTFLHLEGIGPTTERLLWREGVLRWGDFLAHEGALPRISAARKGLHDEVLERQLGELRAGRSWRLGAGVKKSEHWRFYEEFGGRAVCLDIETNGLATWQGGYVTMVGLYGAGEYTCLIHDRDLTRERLEEELAGYDLLITFFGAGFDVPFLKAYYPGIEIDMPHFDLCFGARKLGLKGGLKKLEPVFGLRRPEEVDGLSSFDAVILWEQYLRGSEAALETLIGYNREDTVNLGHMAGEIYAALRERTGIEEFL